MKKLLVFLAVVVAAAPRVFAAETPPQPGPRAVSLFDGRTLAGWEGNPALWRVEDGCLTGGSLTETVRENDFLATTRDYTNFVVRFQIRLRGTEGFVNSGFQIRSQRVPNNSEMIGYQCDYGEPNWYGGIYDESRRNRLLAGADMKILRPALNPDREGWNDYVIRADGPRITTWINGVLGVDYVEKEVGIPDFDRGKFGIQIHGGGKGLVQVRNISVEELPPTPPGRIFRGAPEPEKSSQHNESGRAAAQTASRAEPVSPEEQRARFTVAPGFTVELVAAEDIPAGFGKCVTVDWDQRGNLWTMTALEYPVDANEAPGIASALYASKARDKVLVYDRDPKSPTGYARQPRVFAEGLAIPLGILPYKNGVYVQHGPDIVFLSDTNSDGRADQREVILTGFGVQDSHLFPHQFTRAPGGWIWFAQGAFNYGRVFRPGRQDRAVPFDQTRMAKFRHDGSDFEITSQGPCNIWGLHMTMEGETWIQEANDYGYPAMPFHEYANYPGCSQAQWKSYAPEFPGTAPHFQMGGTGLSGLAISDRTGWPPAYCDVIYIANPITRKIQAIKAERDGPRHALTKLPDFIQSGDEMFRPVALRWGPDGCLYFVDWYNKIISHNEVPRNHPERDKQRGRIWRARPADFKPFEVPDFTTLSGDELLAKLGGENTTQSHLAWQAIGDRQMTELAPKLKGIIGDASQSAARRIAALWALEGLWMLDGLDRRDKASEYLPLLKPLLTDSNRNIRREAVRVLGLRTPVIAGQGGFWSEWFDALAPLANDPDAEVRAALIKTINASRIKLILSSDPRTATLLFQQAMPLLIGMAHPSLASPTMRSTSTGRTIPTGTAYEREFERYLVRMLLERSPTLLDHFLDQPEARALPAESRLVAALALEPKVSAARVAALLPELSRPPGDEELLRLAQFPDEPGVGAALKSLLRAEATGLGAVESLLRVRTKLDGANIAPMLTEAARDLIGQGTPVSVELGAKLANSFQLASLEPELIRILRDPAHWKTRSDVGDTIELSPAGQAALLALRDLKSDQEEVFSVLALRGAAPAQSAAIEGLAVSRNPAGAVRLVSLYADLAARPRRAALTALSGTKASAAILVKALRGGAIPKDDVDAATFERLHALLADQADLALLTQEMTAFLRAALRLDGKAGSYVDTDITLAGEFTVETWVKLDEGINNRDGILGAPGGADFNFADGVFRVWCGPETGDRLIATRKTPPQSWTHLAVTRDAAGVLRLYWNGELETTDTRSLTNTFSQLDIGRTTPGDGGTGGWLSEFRVWNRARTADEIRTHFDRSLAGEARPEGLVFFAPGSGPWGTLRGGARVEKTTDYPALLTAAEAREIEEKFGRYRALAVKTGDTARGQSLFAAACAGCHSVAGQGGQVGPVLNGAGALGVESLLRNLLTPGAAMEPGYRVFRVELKDGEVLDGIRVSEDQDAVVLRRPHVDDLRIPQANIRRAAFTRASLMPDGLLEALPPGDVTDLFAYLKTLK